MSDMTLIVDAIAAAVLAVFLANAILAVLKGRGGRK